jgi:hypothetical protein
MPIDARWGRALWASRLAALVVALLLTGCGDGGGGDGGIDVHGDISRQDIVAIVQLIKADEPTYPILSIHAESFPAVVVWTGWYCGDLCGVFHLYSVALVDGTWEIRTREDWIS